MAAWYPRHKLIVSSAAHTEAALPVALLVPALECRTRMRKTLEYNLDSNLKAAALPAQLRLGTGHLDLANDLLAYGDMYVERAEDIQLPACSFLEDTADALMRVAAMPAGLYHLDANGEGRSFHAIACALNALRGDPWRIELTHDFVCDQRLLDDHLTVSPLRSRLLSL